MADPPIELPPAMLVELRTSYANPARAYHHFGHVEEVLEHFATLELAEAWRQPSEVYLAILFHDAIYIAGARDNEARSATLAREAIARHLADRPVDVDAVERLILLTAQHGRLEPETLDDDTRHFLDCDMAILGSAPAIYDHYEQAIALEYAGVPAPAYRMGRAAFLTGLLARPRIFLSDRFHASHDGPARTNLRRALDQLTRR